MLYGQKILENMYEHIKLVNIYCTIIKELIFATIIKRK